MKRLYIIVEGQTEREFVTEVIAPYFQLYGIFAVTPICIRTSKQGRGGFVNYKHLKNDAKLLLDSSKDDFVVTMMVDYFRCPTLPWEEKYTHLTNHVERVQIMEKCIAEDINDTRFIPYIQLHEFEALLYSSNEGFRQFLSEEQAIKTGKIVESFDNPEEINSSPEYAPSKRLLAIKPDYDKVIEGNLIAMSVGLSQMLLRCPRFKSWIEHLIEICK